MNTLMNYRHGDLAFIGIDSLPKGLKKSSSKIILKIGSNGKPHSFDKGTWYPKEERQIIGYLSAKNTKLFHNEHSPKGGKIEDGFYKIIRQVEIRHTGMKLVID